MKAHNPLPKIDPGHMWIWIAPILIVVIIAIAAWTGASEVRIEVDSFKVVVNWP
jgi:heme/copper-type cytochrome/quinol oxidase subunit 2